MLDRVDDAVTGTNGFTELVKQANEYAYDGNGNLTSDANKGYNSIQYNYLNLPKRVGTTSQYISYIYDATGTKLAKIGTGGAYTYYAGSFVYNGSSLNYIINREGMYLPGGNYQYYLKDHLGNTRLVVNTSGTGGTVVQQTDYYPFGMDIATYNGGVDNKYRYNGKEFQDDMINGKRLEWYDYGARFYDPVIGRFTTVDPMAEITNSVTPYHYCLNNPISNIDPTGMWTETATSYTTSDPDEIAAFCNQMGTGQGNKDSQKKDSQKKDSQKKEETKKEEAKKEYPEWKKTLAFFLYKLDESINFYSDLLGGPEGENVSTIDKLDFQIKTYAIGILISKIKLPTEGSYSFKTPKGWKNTKKLPTSPNGGFIDELGNIWKLPKGSNIQGEFHWDVTLSKKGQQRYNTTKNHLNINQNGEVAH